MSKDFQLTASGSGFYDRAALLNRHRQQRDQLRRHVRNATNRDLQRLSEQSIRDEVELVNPFQQQSGLGIPGDDDDENGASRPWTAENGPETIDVPASLEGYEDPYDPAFAAEMEAKHGPSMMPHETPPEEKAVPPPVDYKALWNDSPSEVLVSLRHLQHLLEAHDNDSSEDEEDEDERRYVKTEIDLRISQLTELQLHIDQFINRNAHVDAELSTLLQRRDMEMSIIRDTMNSLGQRQSSELIVYQWDQELKRREDRSAKALAKQLRITRDIGVGTVTPPPEIDEPLPARSRQRTVSIRRASLFGGDGVTLSRTSSGMYQPDSASQQDLLRGSPTDTNVNAKAKLDRSLKVARALSMLTSRTKKVDEDNKADPDVVDFEAEAVRIRKMVSQHPPPSGSTVVFVHLCVKHSEVFDAWEREYSAFMIATVRITRFVVQQAEEFRGYVVDFGRFHYDLAFSSEADAIQCVMHIQAGLVSSIEYVPALLRFRGTVAVNDPKFESRILFKGVRLAGGMHSFDADEARPWRLKTDYDAFTRRLLYIGPEAGVAKQLAELARGGEVLVSSTCWSTMKERAPLQVFTTVVVKESVLRISPEEARQTALGTATSGLMDDGCYALPVCAIYNFEQQNRKTILGPHPREFLPAENTTSEGSPPGLDDHSVERGSFVSHGGGETSVFVMGPAASTSSAGYPREVHESVGRMGLNLRALRASADNTHATFVVVCVPHLGKILQLPCGVAVFELFRTTVQKCVDAVNNVKRTFFSRSVGGQLSTVGSGDGFDVAGIISASFDEFCIMFKTETSACQWALTMHEELQHMDWPAELAEFNRKIYAEQPAEHWGGLRASIGLGASVPSITFHRSTGLYVYDGPGLLTARELALTARGGETLIPARFVDVLNLRGIPKYEYSVECINGLKTAKENWIYSLYSKAFLARRADLGPLRQDLLIKLSSNLNEIRNSGTISFGQVAKKVTPATLNQSKRTDVFLAAAHKLSTSHQGYDAVLRAVSNGIIDDRAADVILQLLRQGEKQGVVDRSVLDEAEPPKELPPDDEELKEKEKVVTKYSPVMAAAELRTQQPSRWAKIIGMKIDEFKAIELPGKRKTRAVLTQTNFDFMAGDPPPTLDGRRVKKQRSASQAGIESSREDDEEDEEGRTDDSLGDDEAGIDAQGSTDGTALPRARTHRKRKAEKGSDSPKIYLTEAERLEAKENKWKALHKAMQEKRSTASDAVAEAAKALALRRTEERLQALVEQKAKAEERRNKRKEAWKIRQQAKKEALKEVIQRKLKELVLQQEKFVAKTERFKNIVRPDEAPPTVSIFVDNGTETTLSASPPRALQPVDSHAAATPHAPPIAHSESRSMPQEAVLPALGSTTAPKLSLDATTPMTPPSAESSTLSSPSRTLVVRSEDPRRSVSPSAVPQQQQVLHSPTKAPQAVVTEGATTKRPSPESTANNPWEPSPPREGKSTRPTALTSPPLPSSSGVEIPTHQPARTGTAGSNASSSPSLRSQRTSKLTATALAAFADTAADELTKAALDRLSLSSMDSSLISMLAEDDDHDDDDEDNESVDVGSDVEEMLVAAGLKNQTPAHATAGASKSAARWERKAKKLVKQAMTDSHQRSAIPSKAKGIQCDLGPRVVVKKEPPAPQPKRAVPIATFAAEAPALRKPFPSSTARGGVVTAALSDETAPQPAGADASAVANAALQPTLGIRKEKQPAPTSTKETLSPVTSPTDKTAPQLVIKAANWAELAMETEADRILDNDDEELSYLIHLAQRRDVIADFRDIVVALSTEGHEVQKARQLYRVPGLARRCALTLVAPIMHYLEQLVATQSGAEKEKTMNMLQSVRRYEVEERARRRQDAKLLWLIVATRYSAETKTKRAMVAKSPELHRAKIAVVAAMLKKLTVLKDLERREREGRLAIMVHFLDDLFDSRIASIPNVDPQTELAQFVAPKAVKLDSTPPPSVSNAISSSSSAVVPKQQTRKATGAALRASGVTGPRKIDTAGYVALQSLLKELDPTLTLMPNSVNPEFDPETGECRRTGAFPVVPPVAPVVEDQRRDTSAEELMSSSIEGEHHAKQSKTSRGGSAAPAAAFEPSPPREHRALRGDLVVGKISDDERLLRLQTRQIEFMLQHTETDKAAMNLDHAGTLRALPTVPAFDPTRPSTEGQYREWIGDLNNRIALHTKSILQREDGPPPPVGNVVLFGSDPRSRASAVVKQGYVDVPHIDGLPPVRGAPKASSARPSKSKPSKPM